MPIPRPLQSAAHGLLALALFGPASCSTEPPPPTPDEIKIRDYWADHVAPEAREDVMRSAQRHTSWSEKHQVQWEIERFHTLAMQAQRKQHNATTEPALPPLPY